MAKKIIDNVYSEIESKSKKKSHPKKYYWNDVCYGFNHSGLSNTEYITSVHEFFKAFRKLNKYAQYLRQFTTLYNRYYTALWEENTFYELKTRKGVQKRYKRKKQFTDSQMQNMASQSAKEDFYESITDPDEKELVELYFSSLSYLSDYNNLSITDISAQAASNTISKFVTKAGVSDELKEYHVIFGEDNPGNQGTGECERLTIETQNKINDKMSAVLPSAQEKIENGAATSSFESSADSAKNKQEEETLKQAFGLGGSTEQDSLQVDTASLSNKIQSYNTLTSTPTLTAAQSSDPEAAELLRGKQLAYNEKYGVLNTSTAVDIELNSEEAAFMDDLMNADDNHPGLAKTILNNFNFIGDDAIYTIATDEEVANKEAYLKSKKAISKAKTEMFQEGLGCATNIAQNAISLAFQGTAAWAQCKSLYSKEGLKEIWEEIQDATWGTMKTYGKQKVSELQQEIIQLPIEATSYAATRIAYYTSYFTTEIMKEVNLSKLMTPEELEITTKQNVQKAKEKQKAVETSVGKVKDKVQKINQEVNKISGFIANGMSYVVEAPTILIKYLDNIMDMGFSYTDWLYDEAVEGAENFIYKEIDISSKAIGNFAATRIVTPIKVQLQDTMSQINIMKAAAVVKAAAAIATAISKIAAKLGL